MHVLFEESIEILNDVVAKVRRNRADFCGREDAEQVLREVESYFYLKLHHRPLVIGDEEPLECSHLNSEFFRDDPEPQLHIAMSGKNEMAR